MWIDCRAVLQELIFAFVMQLLFFTLHIGGAFALSRSLSCCLHAWAVSLHAMQLRLAALVEGAEFGNWNLELFVMRAVVLFHASLTIPLYESYSMTQLPVRAAT